MTAKIIDGQKIAAGIRAELKQKLAGMKKKPGLAVVIAGNNPASLIYVENKQAACKELGIYSEKHQLLENATEKEVLALIQKLNKDPKIHGILVQLPLPRQINEDKVIGTIDPKKDVDGLHPLNMGKLLRNEKGRIPCTPKGIIKLIESTGIEFEGKSAVVIGRGNLVGKPISLLLQRKNCTVTMCHSRTRNLADYTRSADILVVAAGKPKLITGSMIKQGAVVIDVGITKINEKIMGDVEFESAKEKAGWITPNPGGVGPMTVAMLMDNVIEACENY